jgi:hypothetical protein
VAHDLTRDELAAALTAWSQLCAHAEPLAETLPASLGWLRARWEAGDDHLPLHLVHDLGHLLLRGRDFRFASTRALARWPDDERALRLAYEDRVVGRWALDRSVTEAHVVIAGLAPSLRDAAVAHAIGLALAGPLRAVARVRGNPAHLRALAAARAPATTEDPAAAPDPGWRAWALAQLADSLAAVPAGRLLGAEDLWEIAHLPALPSESARLALRELLGVVEGIGPVSPGVAGSIRRRAREVPTDREEADHYPAGGFDAIATRGAFENLVRSEVMYVGEGVASGSDVDLFDVRFVEHELLFYTRDESPLLDARREVTVVFDRPARLRHKRAALPAQTLVLAEALALGLQADLVRVFGPAGARVRLAWRCDTDDDRVAAAEEQGLLALPLAAEIAHRRVELGTLHRWGELPAAPAIVLSPSPPPGDFGPLAWVETDRDDWLALDRSWPAREGPTALRTLADALLVAVADGRSARVNSRPSREGAVARG